MTKETAIDNLRNVAEHLEQTKGDTLLPGWDYEYAIKHPKDLERIQSIRRAAIAILNNDNADSGIRVTYQDIGLLLRYIADMME